MADYYIQYPPLPNQSTQEFITNSGITETGNLMDDFRAALVQVLSAVVSDHNQYTLDDLWQLYVIHVIANDGNTEPGNPAAGGRGKGGFVGNNPGNYYGENNRKDPGKGFPTGGYTEPAFANVAFLVNAEAPDVKSGDPTDKSSNAIGTGSGFGANTTVWDSPVKFGSLALRFGGDAQNGVYTWTNSNALDIGANDFCIEAWVYLTALPSASAENGFAILNRWNIFGGNRDYSFTLRSDNKLAFLYSTTGADTNTVESTTTVSWSTGQWYHVAVSRESGVIRFFVDGTQVGADISGHGAAFWDGGATQEVGGMTNTTAGFHRYLEGYMDELRFTIGEAVWTGNAAPPTEAFPTS